MFNNSFPDDSRKQGFVIDRHPIDEQYSSRRRDIDSHDDTIHMPPPPPRSNRPQDHFNDVNNRNDGNFGNNQWSPPPPFDHYKSRPSHKNEPTRYSSPPRSPPNHPRHTSHHSNHSHHQSFSPQVRAPLAREPSPPYHHNSHRRQSSRNNSQSQTSSNSTTTSNSNIATSAITLNETNHGRKRRQERAISTRDIQAAIKHGTKEVHPGNPNLYIFKYNGQQHIVTREEALLVTTMVKTVSLSKKKLSKREIEDHECDLKIIHGSANDDDNDDDDNDDDTLDFVKHEEDDNCIKIVNTTKDTQLWKSHSTIVVDKSGSMRNSDVNGSRTRFGAVWLSLAQDFIEHRIKSGLAGSLDVISIILMGDKAEILIDRWPTNYVLYNKLVDLFHQSEEADQLWQKLQNSQRRERKRPRHSKKKNVKFSQRDSKKLNDLVRPQGHGCYGPSLLLAEELLEKNDNESSALSLLLLSDGRPSDFQVFNQSRQDARNILKDVTGRMASRFGRRFSFSTIGMGSNKEFDTLKELVDAAKDYGGVGSFSVPSMSCAAIGRAISSVATSLTTTQTELSSSQGRQQRRVRPCIRESRKLIPLLTEVVSADEFDIYMGDTVEHYEYKYENNTKKFCASPLQHPDAAGVAMKHSSFGEGSERLAFQFFEVAKDGVTVVGQPLVAKESRFVHQSTDDDSNWKARDKFAKQFCKVQMSARNAAKEFNKKLDSIVNLDPDTARVDFLHCSIYYLTHPEKGEFAVIVEQKLDGRFQKWNNNNGWHICEDDKKKSDHQKLPAVSEEGEAENIGTAEEPIEIDNGIFVKKEEVAQAFSHFSYIQSGKKMLICDLQGVYNAPKNVLRFTDPVIHYHDARKEGARRRGAYGKTDMGQKGIQNFFRTHECNALCDLVTKGFIDVS